MSKKRERGRERRGGRRRETEGGETAAAGWESALGAGVDRSKVITGPVWLKH